MCFIILFFIVKFHFSLPSKEIHLSDVASIEPASDDHMTEEPPDTHAKRTHSPSLRETSTSVQSAVGVASDTSMIPEVSTGRGIHLIFSDTEQAPFKIQFASNIDRKTFGEQVMVMYTFILFV